MVALMMGAESVTAIINRRLIDENHDILFLLRESDGQDLCDLDEQVVDEQVDKPEELVEGYDRNSVGPSPIYGICPSTCRDESYATMRRRCKMFSELEFSACHLLFPLPYQFVKYCERRNIAFTQMTHAIVCNIVGLMVLGTEDDIKFSIEMFEQVSLLKEGSITGC
ncbi:unnamed protein product [Arabis nemorensis]|uniref:Uncharacterized protein n=1 Tax=Arabis nemorensis TaxID=586526 RepID=A0A565BJE4_9BRAS|nr:unnamed protein product [Arabis nemorensis]